MKKVLSIAAIFTMATFVISCGDDGAAAKADSTRIADSTRTAFVADSTTQAAAKKHVEDSTNNANAAKHVADSTAAADSAAKGGKKKGK